MTEGRPCDIPQTFFKFKGLKMTVPGPFKSVPEQNPGVKDIGYFFSFLITKYFKTRHGILLVL
jgi:hypothetical protein